MVYNDKKRKELYTKMKAKALIEKLFLSATETDLSKGCDQLIAGNPEAEVSKVAVTMFATPNIIRQAKEWGAELIITHEPTFYDHLDRKEDEKIQNEKRKLIDDLNMTIYRYHDHPHAAVHDEIAAGEIEKMNFDCDIEYTKTFDLLRMHLKKPMTPVEVASQIEKNLNIKHVRICGTRDLPCSEISGMFGTPGGLMEELQNDECEILIVGEACEWSLGEYARDCAELGHKKALLILGHAGSERDGMMWVTEKFAKLIPEISFRYFECGEVYTYTE